MPSLYQWRTITKIFILVLDYFMSKTTTTNYKKLHGFLKCRFKKWVISSIEHFLLHVISRRKKIASFLRMSFKIMTNPGRVSTSWQKFLLSLFKNYLERCMISKREIISFQIFSLKRRKKIVSFFKVSFKIITGRQQEDFSCFCSDDKNYWFFF